MQKGKKTFFAQGRKQKTLKICLCLKKQLYFEGFVLSSK